jgi:hypothetical protein
MGALHLDAELLRERQVGTIPAPEATLPTQHGVSFLLPIVGGLGLAAYQPKLAIGAGGLCARPLLAP